MTRFERFREGIEDLVDELFSGALHLDNNHHFRDIITHDTKITWDEELKRIYSKVNE